MSALSASVADGIFSNLNINSTVLHNLTYTLVLHPIAGFFALLALLSGILGAAAASRVSTVFMSIFAFIGWIITLVVFVIDMVLWNVIKERIHSAGGEASLVRPLSSSKC